MRAVLYFKEYQFISTSCRRYSSFSFEHGLGYASICSAGSVLNNIIILPSYPDISEHLLIKRFVKGVFNVKLPTSSRTLTGEFHFITIHYMNQLPVNEELSMK